VKIEWEGQLLGFPRVAATCDYVKPARFQDVLDIDVTVDRIGTKSVTFAFEFSCRGVQLARGKVTSACCHITGDNHLQGIAIPASYRARLE
jgi:4-hydroxybenzoyl-CoA thioesterase/acyl-CoA thioester hydrolase